MGEMRNVYKIWSENLKGRDYLENLGMEENTKMYLARIWWKGVDEIHLVQERVEWQDFVYAIMNFLVP